MEYKKVQHSFLQEAPIKIELRTQLNLSAEHLFQKFEDPDSWGWASIKHVDWETAKPYGEGTTRTVEIEGQGKVQEHFFFYKPAEHMAFRFERGEMKLVNALVEDYRVKALTADSCEFVWTIGIELRGVLRFLTPVLRGVMTKQFGKMLDNLTEEINGAQPG